MQFVGSSILAAAAASVAERCLTLEVGAWMTRAFVRGARAEPTLIRRVRRRSELEALMQGDRIPVAARTRIVAQFDAGDPVHSVVPRRLEAFVSKANDVVDWVESLERGDDWEDRHRKRIDRMTLAQAIVLSDAWHREQAERTKAIDLASGGTRDEMSLPGGAKVVELLTPSALRTEGAAMGHCVGGYWGRVDAGRCRIFSVRDANGGSHVTIEIASVPRVRTVDGFDLLLVDRPRAGRSTVHLAVDGLFAVQVKGKGNEVPVERWYRPTIEFLADKGWGPRPAATGETVELHTIGHRSWMDPSLAVEAAREIVRSEVARGRPVARCVPPGTRDICDAVGPDAAARLASDLHAMSTDLHAPSIVRTASTGGAISIRVVEHAIPTHAMGLVEAGWMPSDPDVVLDAVSARLRDVVADAERDPDALHVLSLPVGCGIVRRIVHDFSLMSGLADRLIAVSRAGRRHLDACVREAREAVRLDGIAARSGRATMSDEDRRLRTNILAGDAAGRFVSANRLEATGVLLVENVETSPTVRLSSVPTKATATVSHRIRTMAKAVGADRGFVR